MRLESALHAQVAAYLRVALRHPWWFTTFPAGGGGRVRGAQLKARGLRAGMPDLLVFGPAWTVIGLELKSDKGRLSKEQVETHDAMRACGFSVFVCRSVDDVEAVLDAAEVPLRATVGLAA